MIDLWLDDERDPDDPRIQELFGAEPGMVWVKSANAAIHHLKNNTVRWISLDHDLGTTKTGYDADRWIEDRAKSGELERVLWTIHSMNVVGARAMRRVLESAERFWRERK